MLEYYCPDCGEQVTDQFRVSLMELFRQDIDNPKKDADMKIYLFLHDGVKISQEPRDFDEEFSFMCRAKLDNEMREKKKNKAESGGKAQDDDDLDLDDDFFSLDDDDDQAFDLEDDDIGMDFAADYDTYMSYLQRADVNEIDLLLGYHMDTANAPFSEACWRYVWAAKMVEVLTKIATEGNQLLQFLLAVNLFNVENFGDMGWACINLKEQITPERLAVVYRMLHPLGIPTLEADRDTVLSLISYLKSAFSVPLNFTNDYLKRQCHPAASEVGNRRFLIDFSYGEKHVYKRICPMCGAHIAGNLGLYPQKIISFVGSPSSGKSNIINALHVCLRHGERNSIPGLNCEFSMQDPHYSFYDEAYKKTVQCLAVEKTDTGTFTSLSVTVTYNKQTFVYTFVDVPGEFFNAENLDIARGQINMQHLTVMKHSSAVCLVVAAEQLMEIDANTANADQVAPSDDEMLMNFSARLEVFQRVVLHQDDEQNNTTPPPVFFIVSKPDAIEPKSDLDYMIVDGEKYWRESARTENQISEKEIRDLFDLLRSPSDNFFLRGADGRITDIINMSKLTEIQKYGHHFVRAIGPAQLFLEGAFRHLTGNEDWSQRPLFPVSPFGFYAVKDVWQLPPEEKLKALEWRADLVQNLTPDELEILANIDRVASMHLNMGDDAPEKSPGRIMKNAGLTREGMEKILLDHYVAANRDRVRYGVIPLLLWTLVYTGLIPAHFPLSSEVLNNVYPKTAGHGSPEAMSWQKAIDHAELLLGNFVQDNSARFEYAIPEDMWMNILVKALSLCAKTIEVKLQQSQEAMLNQEINRKQNQLKDMFAWGPKARAMRKEIEGLNEQLKQVKARIGQLQMDMEQFIADLRRRGFSVAMLNQTVRQY